MSRFSLFIALFLLSCLFFSCGQDPAPADSAGSTDAVVPTEPGPASTSSPDNEFVPHVGVWSGPKKYPLIEITKTASGFQVRECYGEKAEKGVVYSAAMQGDKIIADGPEKRFYKYQLPALGPVSNNLHQMIYTSGIGQVELFKVKEAMPDIPYEEPVNND